MENYRDLKSILILKQIVNHLKKQKTPARFSDIRQVLNYL
jgi:hypothetical protein